MFTGFFLTIGIVVCFAALLLRGVMGRAMSMEGTDTDDSGFLAWMFCLIIFALGLLTIYIAILGI